MTLSANLGCFIICIIGIVGFVMNLEQIINKYYEENWSINWFNMEKQIIHLGAEKRYMGQSIQEWTK